MRKTNLLAAAALAAVALPAAAESIKADVFYYDTTGPFIGAVSRYMAEYAKYEGIEITTYDGKNQQGLQESQLAGHIDANKRPAIVNAREMSVAAVASEHAKAAGVPLIFINREPGDDVLRAYKRSWFIGSKRRLAGIYQAQLLINHFKAHPEMDRNHNGAIDYILLKGEPNHGDTVARSAAFKDAMKLTGHKMNLIEEAFCNWRTERAEQEFSDMATTYGLEDIEAVVCNNDNMALGALKVLQRGGYNTGDPRKFTPLIGVDGMDAAVAAIAEGKMLGTVQQDAKSYARVTVKLLKQVAAGPEADELLNEEELGLPVSDDRRIMVPYSIVDAKRAAAIIEGRDEDDEDGSLSY